MHPDIIHQNMVDTEKSMGMDMDTDIVVAQKQLMC